MSKEKYQALMDQMNRQRIAIDQEKVTLLETWRKKRLVMTLQEAVTELSSQLKKKNHDLVETKKKLGEVRETLDCSWSLVQRKGGGGESLVRSLDEECSLSSRAQLLLAVNDEAAVERRKEKKESKERGDTGTAKRHRHSHHISNTDRQHWLLG